MASNLYNKCADIKAKLDGILLKTDSIINSGLPYVELEYIESTGTQYIDTGFRCNHNDNYTFEQECSISDDNYAGANGYMQWKGGITNNNRCTVKVAYKNVQEIIYVNNTQISSENWSSYNENNKIIGIFRLGNSDSWWTGGDSQSGKLYSFKLWKDDNLVRDLIPVQRKLDSVVCLYDKISKAYFENNGTGTFIAGPTVKGRLPNLNTDKLLLQLYGNNITSNTTWTNLINSSNLTVSNGVRDESTNSMTFNGSSTIIDTGIAQSTLSSGYTMVLRFLPNSWTNYKGLFGLHDTSGENGIVGLQYQDGNIYFGHRNNGNKSVAVSSSKLSTNTWHIAICKFDGTYLYLYIDGTYIGKTSSNTPLTPTGNVIIGKSYNREDRFFYGKISDILLYKRAITDGEIDYIFKNI